MDFTLTEDQDLLRETARKLLDRECPAALVRAHIDDASAYAPLWRHLREYAPLGTGPCTNLVLFLEQTGYVAAPGPFLATALFAALTGDAETVGTVAVAGRAGAWQPDDDPVKAFVLEADRVDDIAVVIPGPAVAHVAPDAARCRLVETVDFSRRVFEVDTTGIDLAAGASPLDPSALARFLSRAYVALAAEMTGTARRIFDMALQYAKERIQFDVPIGSFQAVQHKLAEVSLAIERATAAVQYAAMTIDADDRDAARAAHVAKAAAGEAARRALKDGAQIHGGIGYTWEHDLHLFLRRATGDEHLLGQTGWHHDRIGDLLFS